MASVGKMVSLKRDGLNWSPTTHVKAGLVVCTEEGEPGESWDPLASQPRLLGRSQGNERPRLKN